MVFGVISRPLFFLIQKFLFFTPPYCTAILDHRYQWSNQYEKECLRAKTIISMYSTVMTTEKKKPAMALDEFFVKYERFQNNFWKFYNKVPHQPVFLTPLAQNFDLSGLWCTTASICNLKNHLDGWALWRHTVWKKIERNWAIGPKVMSNKVQMLPVAAEMQKELREIDVKFNFFFFSRICLKQVFHKLLRL